MAPHGDQPVHVSEEQGRGGAEAGRAEHVQRLRLRHPRRVADVVAHEVPPGVQPLVRDVHGVLAVRVGGRHLRPRVRVVVAVRVRTRVDELDPVVGRQRVPVNDESEVRRARGRRRVASPARRAGHHKRPRQPQRPVPVEVMADVEQARRELQPRQRRGLPGGVDHAVRQIGARDPRASQPHAALRARWHDLDRVIAAQPEALQLDGERDAVRGRPCGAPRDAPSDAQLLVVHPGLPRGGVADVVRARRHVHRGDRQARAKGVARDGGVGAGAQDQRVGDVEGAVARVGDGHEGVLVALAQRAGGAPEGEREVGQPHRGRGACGEAERGPLEGRQQPPHLSGVVADTHAGGGHKRPLHEHARPVLGDLGRREVCPGVHRAALRPGPNRVSVRRHVESEAHDPEVEAAVHEHRHRVAQGVDRAGDNQVLAGAPGHRVPHVPVQAVAHREIPGALGHSREHNGRVVDGSRGRPASGAQLRLAVADVPGTTDHRVPVTGRHAVAGDDRGEGQQVGGLLGFGAEVRRAAHHHRAEVGEPKGHPEPVAELIAHSVLAGG
mmetsp:Transcript_6570/g.12323  ORF Transcript_6570/g.12323 Transcript_6570/m.12323 type:complete len:554 (+) Transcript_6570:6866-8527(+)